MTTGRDEQIVRKGAWACLLQPQTHQTRRMVFDSCEYRLTAQILRVTKVHGNKENMKRCKKRNKMSITNGNYERREWRKKGTLK